MLRRSVFGTASHCPNQRLFDLLANKFLVDGCSKPNYDFRDNYKIPSTLDYAGGTASIALLPDIDPADLLGVLDGNVLSLPMRLNREEFAKLVGMYRQQPPAAVSVELLDAVQARLPQATIDLDKLSEKLEKLSPKRLSNAFLRGEAKQLLALLATVTAELNVRRSFSFVLHLPMFFSFLPCICAVHLLTHLSQSIKAALQGGSPLAPADDAIVNSLAGNTVPETWQAASWRLAGLTQWQQRVQAYFDTFTQIVEKGYAPRRKPPCFCSNKLYFVLLLGDWEESISRTCYSLRRCLQRCPLKRRAACRKRCKMTLPLWQQCVRTRRGARRTVFCCPV